MKPLLFTSLIFGLHAQELKIEVLRVRPNVAMLASPAGNMVVQVGEQSNADGVLLIDTLPAAQQVLTEIRRLSSKPLRYILNTSANPARSGGNEAIGKTGKALPAFSNANFGLDSATIIAQDEVLTRMSRPKAGEPRPFGEWPTLTFDAAKDLHFNGEAIQMIHIPHAHSDGDALVFLRNSNVIVTGEIFTTIGYPKMDLERGGGIEGIIAGLNRIIDLAIPADNEEGGTMIVPAYGRLCDEADVSDYRDMVTIIRDRVRDLMKRGKTLAEVQASKPTFDYDGRYSKPSWTGTQLVEAIYRSLPK